MIALRASGGRGTLRRARTKGRILWTLGVLAAIIPPAARAKARGAVADSCAHPHPGARADQFRDSLPAIAQGMLDAIAPGDSAMWSRYLAPNGRYTDENGESRTARELVATIRPLPKGFSGGLCVANLRMTTESDVAVLSYDALEHETIFGQTLHTRYHMTDTYLKRDGRWRLLASQTSVLPSEHTAVRIEDAELKAYVGTYALDSTFTYAVTTDGARLYGQRGAGPVQALLPLGGDRFFVRGAPRAVKIFRRGAGDAVDAMIDRRDNNDLVWRRVIGAAAGAGATRR